jgi:hypothetical protein
VFCLVEHLGFHCRAPIYHSSGLVELLEVSRREAELLGFQASRGAHHSLEENQIHRV